MLPLRTFPRLRQVYTQIWGRSVSITSFLARQPTLTHVRSRARTIPHDSSPIPLPHVEYYAGIALFLRPLIASSLRQVRLDWGFLELSFAEIDELMLALRQTTMPSIPLVSSHECRHDRCIPLVTSTSARMPHTETFRLEPDAGDTWDRLESPIRMDQVNIASTHILGPRH
jgi:hypothetical protein